MQSLNGFQTRLKRVPITSLVPVCYDKPTKFLLYSSALDVCACDNIWLKKATADGNLTVLGVGATCEGAEVSWTDMTVEELEDACHPLHTDIGPCSKGKTNAKITVCLACTYFLSLNTVT